MDQIHTYPEIEELGLTPEARGQIMAALGTALPEVQFSTERARDVSASIVGSPIVCRDAAMRPSVGPRYKHVGVPLAIAAALTIGFFGIKHIPNIIQTKQSIPQTKTYTTTPGQRANITLADGSQVTLAPATTIHVTNRNVDLQGEAVFTVTHVASAPFTVKTDNASITVLGTRFAVRRYAEDSVAHVAVADGRVSANTAVLSAGDAATINSSGTKVRHNADINAYFAWTSGQLVFNQTPLADVLPVLSRWYNVDFVMADPSLATRPLTASLDENTLTHEILSVIASALDMRYTRVGRTITLYTRSTK